MSEAMGTVRAFPKRSEGPQGKRWNCFRGAADADAQWAPLHFVLVERKFNTVEAFLV
ncbi:MAG: hypothetical protein ACOYVK_05775 [Bacillota bacterium]